MKRRIAGLAVVVLVVQGIQQAASGAIVQWIGNGHYYELVGDYTYRDASGQYTQRWSWQDSKVMAEERSYFGLSGHLVTITSAAENQFILDTFFQNQKWVTWIGLTDSEDYGGFESKSQPNPKVDGWVWVTGERVEYTNWLPGIYGDPPGEYPYNFYPDSDFAAIGNQLNNADTTTYWGDWQSGNGGHAQYLVEYEAGPEPATVPEPSTLIIWSLLGALAVGLVGWCRRKAA